MRKILVCGSGAFAHMLSRVFTEHPDTEQVYHYPANVGIQEQFKYTPVTSRRELDLLLSKQSMDMAYMTTVEFQQNVELTEKLVKQNTVIASASNEMATLEWSKAEGKKFLEENNLPTPSNRVVLRQQLLDEYHSIPRPWVLKYDQDWRAGTQTIIITDANYIVELEKLNSSGVHRLTQKNHGDFDENQKFIIDEYIEIKREYSYHIMLGAKNWQYLGASRDYKKFREGDVGFNTSGMGCYSPVPDMSPELDGISQKIWEVLNGKEFKYGGVMYLGIAEDVNGKLWILEINTRQGDPEFQSALMTYEDKNQFLDTLIDMVSGNVLKPIKFSNKSAVTVRLVHKNYLKIVELMATGQELPVHVNPHVWPEFPGFYVSLNQRRKLLNSTVVTTGDTVDDAADNVYGFLKGIQQYQFTYRKDIGYFK